MELAIISFKMDLTGVLIPRMNWDNANLLEEFKKFHQHVKLILQGALAGIDYSNIIAALGRQKRP